MEGVDNEESENRAVDAPDDGHDLVFRDQVVYEVGAIHDVMEEVLPGEDLEIGASVHSIRSVNVRSP